eukprot:5192961-Pyramimonas_sp.AAC.1
MGLFSCGMIGWSRSCQPYISCSPACFVVTRCSHPLHRNGLQIKLHVGLVYPTVDHLLALTLLAEGYDEWCWQLWVCLVGCEKVVGAAECAALRWRWWRAWR